MTHHPTERRTSVHSPRRGINHPTWVSLSGIAFRPRSAPVDTPPHGGADLCSFAQTVDTPPHLGIAFRHRSAPGDRPPHGEAGLCPFAQPGDKPPHLGIAFRHRYPAQSRTGGHNTPRGGGPLVHSPRWWTHHLTWASLSGPAPHRWIHHLTEGRGLPWSRPFRRPVSFTLSARGGMADCPNYRVRVPVKSRIFGKRTFRRSASWPAVPHRRIFPALSFPSRFPPIGETVSRLGARARLPFLAHPCRENVGFAPTRKPVANPVSVQPRKSGGFFHHRSSDVPFPGVEIVTPVIFRPG